MPSVKIARIALAVFILGAAFVLLQPQPAIASSGVTGIYDLVLNLGFSPTLATPARVEAVVNAALFAPPAALAVIAFPRLRWTDVATAGFIGSLIVELLQGMLLPDRSAQAIDVVANTLGAVIGSVTAYAAIRLPGKSPSSSPTAPK